MHVAVIVSGGLSGTVPLAGLLRCATSVEVVQQDDHQTEALAKADVAVLTCALSAKLPVAAAVHTFAERGSPVLGLGDGFAGLCSAGLLPGRFAACEASATLPLSGYLRTEGRLTPFTAGIPAGRVCPQIGMPPTRTHAHLASTSSGAGRSSFVTAMRGPAFQPKTIRSLQPAPSRDYAALAATCWAWAFGLICRRRLCLTRCLHR